MVDTHDRDEAEKPLIETTMIRRPLSGRPPNGFAAWQTTLKYMSERLSPDTALRLKAYPVAGAVKWDCSVSWAEFRETASDCASAGEALEKLWVNVSDIHDIFESENDRQRQPVSYDEQNWFDESTHDTLHRLLWTTHMAFENWTLVIVYQPIEAPMLRVVARLVCGENVVGGRGASLLETLRKLFRNAAPLYAAQVGISSE